MTEDEAYLTAKLGDAVTAEFAAEPVPPAQPAGVKTARKPKFSNQLDHAEALMARHPDLRFAPGIGWLHWDGSRWVPKAEAIAKSAVYTAAKAAIRSAPRDPFAIFLASATGLKAVNEVAREVPGVHVDPEELDDCADRLHTAGLTWDLRNGESWPTDPTELTTKATHARPATDGCPRWLRFLDECFPDAPDMPAFLQRLIGYGLTGLGTEHELIVLHGGGSNGKSTFVEAVTHAFQQYVTHLPIQVLIAPRGGNKSTGEDASPAILQLRGARLVFTSESDREDRLNEARVKQLTGGDSISARALYGMPVTFTPRALLFMSTNHLPAIYGLDTGIWRRVKVVEWRESFKGDRMDRSLKASLQSEAAGIVAWAIEGAQAYHREGLAPPTRVSDAVADYKAESDGLAGFFPGVLVPDPTCFMPRAEVVDAWHDWNQAEHRIPDRDTWKPPTLYKALRERGAIETAQDGKRGFRLRDTTRRQPALRDAEAALQQPRMSVFE